MIDPDGIDKPSQQPAKNMFDASFDFVCVGNRCIAGKRNTRSIGRRDPGKSVQLQSDRQAFLGRDEVDSILNSSSPDNSERVKEVEPQLIELRRGDRPARCSDHPDGQQHQNGTPKPYSDSIRQPSG